MITLLRSHRPAFSDAMSGALAGMDKQRDPCRNTNGKLVGSAVGNSSVN